MSAADGDVSTRRRAGGVLLVCLLGFLAGQVAAAILITLGAALAHYPGGLSALARTSTPPWWANVLSLVGLWAGFGAAIAYASGPRGLGALPGAWRVRRSDGLYVLLGGACQLAVALIYAPFHVRGFGRPVHHLFGAASGATLALLGVLTSLCAPVVEEWFFRGVVFRAIEAGAGGPGAVATFVAAVASALLFALAHAEALQFAGLALLGVVLAYLVARTRRLVPSVITHASFNSVAFAALLVQLVPLMRRWLTPLRITELVGVLLVMGITLFELHPSLIFSGTLITGGDTASHVALPAFLRTQGNLFNLTPWYPGWYAGMPAYTYYFVLPDFFATLGSYVVGFAVAMKLATILGSMLMPGAAYLMGRLFRAPKPVPMALAMATLPFLFDASYTIDGGNLFSTMAGEYAFSLSLAFALVAIGLFARGMRTGRGYWAAAALLSLTLASHVLPWFFCIGAVAVMIVFEVLQRMGHGDPKDADVRGDLARPVRFAVGAGLLSAGLSAWWLFTFATTQSYSNSMGYTNDNTSTLHAVFTILGWFNSAGGAAGDRWVITGAAIACVVAFVVRDRLGMILSTMVVLSLAVFVFDPQSVIWNERLVPYWYISTHLIVGWLVGYALSRWVARAAHKVKGFFLYVGDGRLAYARVPIQGPEALAAAGGAVDDISDLDVDDEDAGLRDRLRAWRAAAAAEDPAARVARRLHHATIAAIVLGLASTLPGLIPVSASALGLNTQGNQVSGWAGWNYSGYQAKSSWPEYHDIMTTMSSVAKRYGCGRAMWEYNADQDRFGSPEALMLLPYWTNNCVDSMEGLLFESSATTPYHFLDQAELSAGPSNPQVGLPYGPLDVTLGVEHLQMLGVKYYMAFTPKVVAAANQDPALTLVATTKKWPAPGYQWFIYKIADAPQVEPLAALPNVVSGVASRKAWLAANVAWWLHPRLWSVVGAESGPADWPRATSIWKMTSVVVQPTTVSDVTMGSQSLSFDVTRLDAPVLVKVSYFPRWHATGALGPYRVSPNMMVVVPTSHHVSLAYGSTPVGTVGNVLTDVTVLAALGAVWVALRRRRTALR